MTAADLLARIESRSYALLADNLFSGLESNLADLEKHRDELERMAREGGQETQLKTAITLATHTRHRSDWCTETLRRSLWAKNLHALKGAVLAYRSVTDAAPSVVTRLLNLLKNAELAPAAAETLEKVAPHDHRLVGRLLRALKGNSDAETVPALLRATARLDRGESSWVVAEVRRRLRTGPRDIRLAAVEAAAFFRRPNTEVTRELLKLLAARPGREIRSLLVNGLCYAGRDMAEAVKAVVGELASAEPSLRVDAADALRLMSIPDQQLDSVVESLSRLLDRTDPGNTSSVRRSAVKTLLRTAATHRFVEAALKKASFDPESEVGLPALYALYALGGSGRTGSRGEGGTPSHNKLDHPEGEEQRGGNDTGIPTRVATMQRALDTLSGDSPIPGALWQSRAADGWQAEQDAHRGLVSLIQAEASEVDRLLQLPRYVVPPAVQEGPHNQLAGRDQLGQDEDDERRQEVDRDAPSQATRLRESIKDDVAKINAAREHAAKMLKKPIADYLASEPSRDFASKTRVADTINEVLAKVGCCLAEGGRACRLRVARGDEEDKVGHWVLEIKGGRKPIAQVSDAVELLPLEVVVTPEHTPHQAREKARQGIEALRDAALSQKPRDPLAPLIFSPQSKAELAAEILEPIKQRLQTMPQSTMAQKRAIASWLNAELRDTGLRLRCPETDYPAVLVVTRSGRTTGRFTFSYRDESGTLHRPFSTPDVKSLLPHLSLIPSSERRGARR